MTEPRTYPPHQAGHDLPLTGWSDSWSAGTVSVYCGRCRGSFAPDEAWVRRYADTKRRNLQRELASALAYWRGKLGEVDQWEADGLRAIAGNAS